MLGKHQAAWGCFLSGEALWSSHSFSLLRGDQKDNLAVAPGEASLMKGVAEEQHIHAAEE